MCSNVSIFIQFGFHVFSRLEFNLNFPFLKLKNTQNNIVYNSHYYIQLSALLSNTGMLIIYTISYLTNQLEYTVYTDQSALWSHFSTGTIYIMKQDIRIYVPYSRPNGWTDWANIFCGHSWVARGCLRLKKNWNLFFKICFPTGNAGPFN